MSESKRLVIVGMGYVGLPLLVTTARAGWSVVGIDSNLEIIESLSLGKSHIEDIRDMDIELLLTERKIHFTSEAAIMLDSDVVVFCLPTPVEDGHPNLAILLEAIKTYAPFFKSGALVVSESSSHPGTLREKIKPVIDAHKRVEKLFMGHSPERVDPGNKVWTNENTPRIVSGIDKESLGKMKEFYGSFTRVLVEVDTPEIAEAAKMFENTFRQVNIALVNEFARYCNKVGIPTHKVLEAASTKPFGFMRFNYGIGVGGHCIPVDPHYLLGHARENGTNLELVEVSNRVNAGQPRYVFERAVEILGKNLADSRVIVIGLSYKPDTSDMRESPSGDLIRYFQNAGSQIFWFDPLSNGLPGIPRGNAEMSYDLGIVAVLHRGVDYSEILTSCRTILDCVGSIPKNENVVPL